MIEGVQRVVGSVRVAGRLGGRAEQAEVWRLETAWGDGLVLKQHRADGGYRRELWGFEVLAPALGDRAPRRLATIEPRALLIEHLEGTTADATDLTPDERIEVHRQAGELRARLDAVAFEDRDPVPVVRAMEMRGRSGLERARPHLGAGEIARIERAMQPEVFAAGARVPCHRDFGPWNWLVRRTGTDLRVCLVDFGQARPDVWHVDLVKLWAEVWPTDPAYREAFLQGLGRGLTPEDVARLDQLALLHALGTLSWGAEHGIAEIESRGRILLDAALTDAP